MADYFTSDHFKLLNKWKDQKRDESNPEQNQAYEELKRAYAVTKSWAEQWQERVFPEGKVEVRQRPTNQQNNFLPYNWARIFPNESAPRILAYTVGIDCKDGFVIKIDLVDSRISDTQRYALRERYKAIRGKYSDSPIVAILPIERGLEMSLVELVEWSVDAVRNFKLSYADVANQLGLQAGQDDGLLLKHFQGHNDFIARQPKWGNDTTALFCRLARAVNAAGMDWWFTKSTNSQLRFGRKEKGRAKGRPVGWLFLLRDGTLRVAWVQIGPLAGLDWIEINESVVADFESADLSDLDLWPVNDGRNGFWPDDYTADEEELEDGSGDDESEMGSPAKNVIYYGPPGTGKTYKLQQLLAEKYTQDVSSLSESEQIAELIKDLTWWEVLAAALYDLGGRADVNTLMQHAFVQAVIKSRNRSKHVSQTIWGSLQQHAPKSSSTVKVEYRVSPYIFDKDEKSEWFFVGDWKEQCAEILAKVDAIKGGAKASSGKIQHYEFVTFHQSYGYEEFVEGLRPVLKRDAGGLSYEIRPGAFLRLCERARTNPNRKHAMVIDEINRGNISKIFGELITLIEVDKREGKNQAISVTLPYSGDTFSVPSNVDVIGTMNTADRSLALLDTALRRRFEFEELMPDLSALKDLVVSHDGVDIDMLSLLETMNKRIEALYDRDHMIGHAYFIGLSDVPAPERFGELNSIFRNRIIPLLEEYFFEDWQKIRLVLGDNQKEGKQYQFIQEISRDEDLAVLFGQKEELEQYAIRSRYQLNSNGFEQALAYRGIYDPKAATDRVE